MRKIFFAIFGLFFLQNIFSAPCFDGADFRFTSELTLPAFSSEKKKAFSASTGIKLCVSDLFFVSKIDARSYITLPKTQLDAFAETESAEDIFSLFDDVRYGVGLSLFDKTVPVQVKAGKLSYSKSISRLKNPAPSALSNPLKKSFAFSTGVGASLPTLTSSSQPKSVALCVSSPDGRLFVPLRAEAFVTEEKNCAMSVSASRSFGKFLSVQTALTATRFFVENNASILKKNNAGFDGDFMFAGLWETNLKSPFFKANLFCALHQSPYENMGAWFRIDGRAAYKSAMLDFSFFSLPTKDSSPSVAPLICIDSSVLRTLWSASINPQYLIFLTGKNAASLRFGLSAFEAMKICATKGAELFCVGKFRFGMEYEASQVDLKFDFTAANLIFSGNPPTKSSTPEKYFSVSFDGNLAFPLFCTAFRAGAKYYPPYDSESKDKKSITFNMSFVPKKLSPFTFSGGFDMVFKEQEKASANFDSGVCVKTKSKFVNSSVKCTLSVPF